MNPYTRPALRSAIVLAVLGGLYVASFWTEGPSSTSIPYVQHTGYVSQEVGNIERGYFVTTVQRHGQPPWLIVAKPLHVASEGFETKMTSRSHSVTIDGAEFHEIPGQAIVALDDGRDLSVWHYPSDGNAVLKSLPRAMGQIPLSDFESLFANPG